MYKISMYNQTRNGREKKIAQPSEKVGVLVLAIQTDRE